jgi:hypothetical protein
VHFPLLYLLFNHESDDWNHQAYKAFVESVKPNFPGDSWRYLRYVATFKNLIPMLMVAEIISPEQSEKAWESDGKLPG